MLGECCGAPPAISPYHIGMNALNLAVQDHKPHLLTLKLLQKRLAPRGRADQQPIDAAFQQHREVPCLFFGIFVRIAQKNSEAAHARGIFDPPRQGCPERVGDVGHEEG